MINNSTVLRREAVGLRRYTDALAPYASGAYVNYIDAAIADYATAYYGDNLMRLTAVKRAYDPDGFFSFPQAIPT